MANLAIIVMFGKDNNTNYAQNFKANTTKVLFYNCCEKTYCGLAQGNM